MANLRSLPQAEVSSIENEHERLALLVNRLNDKPWDLAHFSEVFIQFSELITKHFHTEERVLKSCGMPPEEVASHILAHKQIIEKCTAINLRLMNDKGCLPSDVARTMKEWVFDHLRDHDSKLEKYLPNGN